MAINEEKLNQLLGSCITDFGATMHAGLVLPLLSAARKTYVFTVRSKQFQSATQVVTITEDLNELNFTPAAPPETSAAAGLFDER